MWLFLLNLKFLMLVSYPYIYQAYIDTVGRNERAIKDYIKNQLEEEYTKDQMTLKEYVDPFTGGKNK